MNIFFPFSKEKEKQMEEELIRDEEQTFKKSVRRAWKLEMERSRFYTIFVTRKRKKGRGGEGGVFHGHSRSLGGEDMTGAGYQKRVGKGKVCWNRMRSKYQIRAWKTNRGRKEDDHSLIVGIWTRGKRGEILTGFYHGNPRHGGKKSKKRRLLALTPTSRAWQGRKGKKRAPQVGRGHENSRSFSSASPASGGTAGVKRRARFPF